MNTLSTNKANIFQFHNSIQRQGLFYKFKNTLTLSHNNILRLYRASHAAFPEVDSIKPTTQMLFSIKIDRKTTCKAHA